jgi:hypothetical protein
MKTGTSHELTADERINKPEGIRHMTKDMKMKLLTFSADFYEDFREEYMKLGGKEKCSIYVSLLKYCVPAEQAIQFTDDKGESKVDELLDRLTGKK